MADAGYVVLGSRSPRRLELLSLIVPRERIIVQPPGTTEEPGFEMLHAWPAIEARLTAIARAKNEDVRAQLRGAGIDSGPHSGGGSGCVVLTADTMIVGRGDDGGLQAIGQPPENEAWREVVGTWFRRYYFGRVHTAATTLCLTTPEGERHERLVKTEVAFSADGERFLEWYLATGEPRGKAGGYALQGAGSLFVERIDGSPSNVIGLPLRETRELLADSRTGRR